MGFGHRFKQARYIYMLVLNCLVLYMLIRPYCTLSVYSTESHSSLSNMIVEGVIKSALNMIRAARFCNLERRSIFAAVMFPQMLQP